MSGFYNMLVNAHLFFTLISQTFVNAVKKCLFISGILNVGCYTNIIVDVLDVISSL